MSKHLYPVLGAFIPEVPAIEQTVTDKRAAELLSHQPPAFTLERPADKPKRVRKPKKPQPAAAPAAPPVEGE